MWPTLYEFHLSMGEFPVRSWGLMIILAFLGAGLLTQARATRAGMDGYRLAGLYVVAFLAGLAGARLLHFLMAEPEKFFSDPLVYLRFWEGGFAFYGGAILATLCGVVYARWRQLDVWRIADLTAPTLMLGLGIGRIGCFLAGCCHGASCPLPDAAFNLLPDGFSGGALYVFSEAPFLLEEFHNGVGLNDSPMYPTHLWESAGAISLFAILSFLWKKRRFDGQVFGWLLILYSLMRSLIETFRGDLVRGVDWLGLFSTSQLLSIPVFVIGILVLVLRRNSGLSETSQPDQDQDLLEEMERLDPR